MFSKINIPPEKDKTFVQITNFLSDSESITPVALDSYSNSAEQNEAYEQMIARGKENIPKYTMGRGYRRVVASPKPVDVVEKNVVSTLMKGGHVVITVGGGGIPVISKDGRLIGTPAVIDKDFASAKLAELICADMLVILTAVDRVAINWGKPNQKSLEEMSVAEAEQYCREGHFAPGSMLPKVEAAMSFARVGGTAIIASLENAAAALRGESGTRVHA
jgi:carbamate kinase